MPRTWEDPDVEHPDAKAKGDNDPLDVCEIGLKILGTYSTLDQKGFSLISLK